MTFIANGNKYKVLDPIQLPILRYNSYVKSGLQMAYHCDFQTMFNNNRKSIELLETYQAEGKDVTLSELTAHLYALDDGMLSTSEERFDVAMQNCCSFIVKEGEDLTGFVESEQLEKLEDWNKEAIDRNFFFQKAVLSIKEWKSYFLHLVQNKTNRLVSLMENSSLTEEK